MAITVVSKLVVETKSKNLFLKRRESGPITDDQQSCPICACQACTQHAVALLSLANEIVVFSSCAGEKRFASPFAPKFLREWNYNSLYQPTTIFSGFIHYFSEASIFRFILKINLFDVVLMHVVQSLDQRYAELVNQASIL